MQNLNAPSYFSQGNRLEVLVEWALPTYSTSYEERNTKLWIPILNKNTSKSSRSMDVGSAHPKLYLSIYLFTMQSLNAPAILARDMD
jgi:hypothetical protein